MQKRLITSALPYINNIPHFGHIVGSHLPADIFARYCRSKGYDTLFIGGTDEHGTPAELSAQEINIPINIFSEVMHKKHKEIYDWFCISYDNFSRTSKDIHKKITLDIFNNLYKKGFILEGEIEQFYSEEDARFLPDRYVIGTCPKCGYTEANGDQCDKCSSMLNPTELINPLSKISKSKPIIKKSKHLFLDLDKVESKLIAWLEKNNIMRPTVKNLALGWIKEGLKKRCITRDIKNGINVPIKGYEDKVFYVWFDAPIGYISSTAEIADIDKYWINNDCQIYHFLGKDNIPFHTIFWPGILLADGRYNLPYNVIGLQNLNYEGQKFSKSKKIGVFCEGVIDSGIDPDIIRAYLIRIIPENSDSDFKWDDFKERINNELVSIYGNFVNRVCTFIYNNLDGYVIKIDENNFDQYDNFLINEIKRIKNEIENNFENGYMRDAYAKFLELSIIGNKYINDKAPWNVIKTDIDQARQILYLCLHLIRILAIISQPFIPNSAQKVWKILNLEKTVFENGLWETIDDIYFIKDKHKINKPSILFKKLEDTDFNYIKERLSKLSDLSVWFK